MPRYLLDTNVLSALMRDPLGPAGQKVLLLDDNAVCTSIVCAAELRSGVVRRPTPARVAQLETVLSSIPTEPMAPPADLIYATVRSELEAAGTLIGGFDMLIAAHALALGCVLITDNEREFRRVPGLTLENWLT
ncbi:MAG: type II toxin-antitoxin system VapC family toxin [Caulobacter sp.]|nr:type II toxin-antitoxin system VapC family toxin [Caulobacter sp.]